MPAPAPDAPLRQVHRARLHPLPEPALAEAFSSWQGALAALQSDGRLLTAALYRDAYSLFLYTEALGAPLDPAAALPAPGGLLRPWPELDGDRPWVAMMDVFHFNAPASLAHWRRSTPPAERQGRLLRLHPDKVASYVYYHFQLQEERAFPGEKYKFIALHGSLLFMYNELPATLETPPLPGLLSTRGTPSDWSDTRMDEHLIPWDASTPSSRGLPLVFSL